MTDPATHNPIPDHPRKWCRQAGCPWHPPLIAHLVVDGEYDSYGPVALFLDPDEAARFVNAYNHARQPYGKAEIEQIRLFDAGEWAGQLPTKDHPEPNEWTGPVGEAA